MEYEFEATISKELAARALRRFILRTLGWGMLPAVLLCVCYLIYTFGQDFGGELGVLSIACISFLTILVLTTVVIYFVRRRQIFSLLDRLGGTPVEIRLDEDEYFTKSSLGTSSLKWEMLPKLWLDPDVICVFFAQNGYLTIPADQIPDGALEFLVAKIKSAGGTILDKR